ncbi:MAG: PIN domain-containing protein [Hyphomicrobium sp.]|nr:PIN domain-containing protein [Hyphomicrobium sp.]
MSAGARYWDSDCFLGWLQEEPDKVEYCQQVLSAAEDGNLVLVTSALTIAEVLALRGRLKIPASERVRVEAFFRQEYIAVRNITRRIAEAARTYVWDYGVSPKDALHVATAVDAGLTLMNTFDGGLMKKSGTIGNPALTIEKPSWTQPKLPMDMPPKKR